MTKIIQISDPHIVPDGQLAYGQIDTDASLSDCVSTINRMLPLIGPVKMAIITGDLTDFGTAEEYSRFRKIMNSLDIPYCAVPGNHDATEVMRTSFSDQTWMPTTGAINWMHDFDDIVVIGLDSSVAGKSHGHLSDATLDFLGTCLNRAKGRPALVGLHHPPFMTGKEKMDVQNLRENEQLAKMVSRYPGELRLICGHVHRNIVKLFGSVVCQIAPGTSHAVTMDQRRGIQNCFTTEPGGFLLHELRDGFVSHHIPVGVYDGPWEFYPDQ